MTHAPTSAVPPRILLVSTYPPTPCGIANYARALRQAMAGLAGEEGAPDVVRLVDPDESRLRPVREVVATVVPGADGWVDTVAAASRAADLVLLQHEYGIYGPDDGRGVVDLLEALEVPVLATLHTVAADPSPARRAILGELLAGAVRVVVHTGTARRRLVAAYGVDSARVAVVPHGVRVAPVPRRPGGPPTILTWGLLCRGKGIERAIAALARLRATVPGVRYLVVGATHPHALAEEGEGYRRELERMVRRRGLAGVVTFLDGYRGEAELRGMLELADVVLLPYDSRDQVSSGVLVDALAAGRPVVATRFPHAVELLSGGAGRVVDHDRIDEMAAAVATYLLDEGERRRAAETARRVTARLGWPVVARRYLELAESIGGTEAVSAAGHTRRLVG